MSESATLTPAIRFDRASRSFGDVRAVDELTLDIQDGEFFTLLGPSGSGKTTSLRLVAGFEQLDSGHIYLFGQDVTELPPYERDVTTVFQDYALFPHMTVADNIGYGLMIRKIDKAERNRRVEEMLEMVRLPGLGKRKPAQLSGGQRQRVALARALINHPRVLLLDEPLGALDLKLRQEMQGELKRIQQQVGITFIYVTHDQEEALTMSDRLAVFNEGKVEQVGSPSQVYEHPVTRFVASFVGVSNLIEGDTAQKVSGAAEPFTIRPEKIRIVDKDAETSGDALTVTGTIAEVFYLGINTRYLIDVDGGGQLVVVQQNLDTTSMDSLAAQGRRVKLVWSREHIRHLVEGA